MAEECRFHSRRQFLTKLGLAGSAAVLLPACEYVEWRGKDFEPFDFDVTLPAFSALKNVGGMVEVKAGVQVVLIRVSATEVAALLAVCPHSQYSLGPFDGAEHWGKWIEAKSVLQCMAHGSQFGSDGSVVRGPAAVPLTRFAVTFDAATGKGRVTGKLAAATVVADAGAASDGGASADATPPAQDSSATDASSADASSTDASSTDASGALLEFDLATSAQTALAQVGGMVAADLKGVSYTANCYGTKPDTPVVLVRVSNTQVACLSRICTHACCEISPDDSGKWHPTAWKAGGVDVPANTLECTCHQSAFGLDGKVLAGPASEPLKVFATQFDPATGKGKVVKS
jgi:Rieske Fe-S protein